MRAAGTLAPLLAALAISAACSHDAVRPTATLAATDTADQVLEGVDFVMTDAGIRRTRVQADSAFLFESSQIASLRHLTVTFFDANGRETSTIQADSGQYTMRDGSMMAWGNVLATTPDGKRLRSQELRYDARNRKISSQVPFVFDHGDRHVEGNSFESDPEFRDIVTQQPRATQRGDGIVLPGQ
jgi:LPS export ABC transporter protein LptC